jgi:hypothetical protein
MQGKGQCMNRRRLPPLRYVAACSMPMIWCLSAPGPWPPGLLPNCEKPHPSVAQGTGTMVRNGWKHEEGAGSNRAWGT